MPSLQGKEILYVDDSAEMRMLVRKILENDGAVVYEADNVARGLKLATERVPHLILTDLNMPFETGFDLLAKRREMPELKSTPIVVLSAMNDRNSIQRAVSLGAADYLLKPFKATLLLQKIRKTLQASGTQRLTFDRANAPRITLSIPAELKMINESVCVLEAPVKLENDREVELQAPFLDQMGIGGASGVKTKTTRFPALFAGPGRYSCEIGFFGVGEKEAAQIRRTLRGPR